MSERAIATDHHRRLSVPFETMAATPAPDGFVFEGYASVFNTPIDAYPPTIIDPGAFTHTLATNRDRIKILWQHDETQPIGRPLDLTQDARGLYLRGLLAKTTLGEQAAELIRSGVMTELSIGFDPLDYYYVGDVRHLVALQLWEISLVTHAANPQALIATGQHSRALERELDQVKAMVLVAASRTTTAERLRAQRVRMSRLVLKRRQLDAAIEEMPAAIRRTPWAQHVRRQAEQLREIHGRCREALEITRSRSEVG